MSPPPEKIGPFFTIRFTNFSSVIHNFDRITQPPFPFLKKPYAQTLINVLPADYHPTLQTLNNL